VAIPAQHFGPWTERDLLALPEDGQRYEIVEGSLLVSPSPSSLHQRAAHNLARLLNRAAPAHFEAVEALGVRLSDRNFQVPDIVVANTLAISANSTALDAQMVALVVEIVSPSSKYKDRVEKPQMYAQGGIPYFWRVEIQERLIVAYRTVSGAQEEMASAQESELLEVTEPFPIRLSPADILERS
jgi:Uma2 family endonuclease